MGVLFYSSCAVLALCIFVMVVRKPRQERNWVPEHSVQAHATITDNNITLHNIVHATYTGRFDCAVKHYDKSFPPSDVRSVWLIVESFNVHAGPKRIDLAHSFLSFGLRDGSYIAISTAGRRVQDEPITFARILPHRNEIIYKVIDESDTLLARAYFEKNDVTLYKLRGNEKTAQKVLLSMLEELNKLHSKATWFDSLTHNCNTEVARHLRAGGYKVPVWHPRYISPTELSALFAKRGVIEQAIHITKKIQKLGADPELSQKIRK